MRFLIDAQLPAILCSVFQTVGLDAIHVEILPKGDESSDKEISTYADQEDLILVTKDFDFYHTHMLHGHPKKLLLITTGNIKNRNLMDLLRVNARVLTDLFHSCNYVELNNDSIIGH